MNEANNMAMSTILAFWPSSKKQLRQVISKVISEQFSCQFIQIPITFSA